MAAVPRDDSLSSRAGRHLTETVLVAAVLTALNLVGFLTELAPWEPAALVFAASYIMAGAFVVWPKEDSTIHLHLRLAVQTGAITTVVYAIGWGPAVAVILGFGIADSMKVAGSKAARPGLAWGASGLAVGQMAISAGVVPSLVPEPAVHGLAILTAFGLTFVVHRFEQMTETKEVFEASLRRREKQFRTLVQNSSDVISEINGDAVITYVSPSVARVFGYEPAELVGTPLRSLLHPDDRDMCESRLRQLITTPGYASTFEYRLRHASGAWRHVETVGANQTGQVHDTHLDSGVSGNGRRREPAEGLVLNTRDITDRKQLEAQLEHRAFHDQLTGLANRALFNDRVDHAVARNDRRENPFAVLFLDLDGFKNINDSFGHAAGDELLKVVASRLRRSLREADTAARLGGDEFAVLIEELTDDSSSARVANRLLESIRGKVTIAPDTAVNVEGSVGIAVSTGSETAEEMLRNADIAMYMAKGRGKGRFEIFEPAMHAAVVSRLELEADLADAIDAEDFVLHYQPIVDLEDGRLANLEALVRWDHPRRGLVSPAEFIPMAEETGLIVPLGRWVLHEACRQMRAWQDHYPTHPPVQISVNLSPVQLLHPGLITSVTDALNASGLRAENLVLEITESALVAESETPVETLEQLKRLGVQIALDDFGTGYSSLGYLQRFPLDMLKIDRSFIDTIDAPDTANPGLMRAIVDIGRSLNLETVAEGIERSTQLAQFQTLPCRFGQGYYFSRPADAQTVEALFTCQDWHTLLRETRGSRAGVTSGRRTGNGVPVR